MKHNREFQALIDRQHGVVARKQLIELGISDKTLRWRLHRGQWRAVLRGVYTVTTGPLTAGAIQEAALLAAGDGALLSHQTAARLWSFPLVVPDDPRVHVTKRSSGSNRRHGSRTVDIPGAPIGPIYLAGSELHPGVVVHRSRALHHIGVQTEQPRTSKADTIVDLATSAPSARAAFGIVVRLATSTTVELDELRRRIEMRRPRRYVKTITNAVETVATGVQSMLEAEFVLRVEISYDLPTPTRQAPVVVDGTVRYEDLLYEMPGGRLIIRLDGKRFHLATETRFRDRRRDNVAELDGHCRLVYGWEDVTGDPAGVASEIRTILLRLGAEAA